MPDYKITVKGVAPIMVRALNPSAARNWAVRDSVTVEPLTTDDAIAMARKGQDVIDITKEPVEPEPQKQEGGEAGAGEVDQSPEKK